jgi:hypothetical protein
LTALINYYSGWRRVVVLGLASMATLAVFLLAANGIFVWFVERQVEERLGNRLDSPVSVDLSGWPVGARLVTGSLPRAGVTVEEVGLPGTGESLGELDIELEEVRYTGESDGPLDPPIAARRARFDSRLTGAEVSGLAALIPGVKGAELSGEGLRLSLPAGATAEADLATKNGGLVLIPDAPILDPELPLIPGNLPGGASVRDVEADGEEVIIRGTADDLGVG